MQFVSVVRGAPVAGQKVAVILSNGSLKADHFRTNSTQVSTSACLLRIINIWERWGQERRKERKRVERRGAGGERQWVRDCCQSLLYWWVNPEKWSSHFLCAQKGFISKGGLRCVGDQLCLWFFYCYFSFNSLSSSFSSITLWHLMTVVFVSSVWAGSRSCSFLRFLSFCLVIFSCFSPLKKSCNMMPLVRREDWTWGKWMFWTH